MEITVREILKLTEGRLARGNVDQQYTGIGSLDEAGKDDISFLGNEKYYRDYLETSAGLIFIPEGIEFVQSDAAIVIVENPSFAFGLVVKEISTKLRSFSPGIHPRAVVAEDVKLNPKKVSIKAGAIIESGVQIGDGTEIGANTVICENAVIGEDCLLYPNVTVREFCRLGDRVIVQPNSVIGSDGFGYELVDGVHVKVDQVGIVVLEDDVEIGSNTAIDRARFGQTVIGKGSKVDNLVQVAHNVKTGNHCLVVSQSGLAGSSSLGNYVTVAAQAGVAGHIEIGDQAILMGRSGAAKNLKGGGVYMGFPARPAKEEKKKLASLAQLPEMIKQFKALKKSVQKASEESH